MRAALVACGALAREVREVVDRRGWAADVVAVSALDHLRPERIAGDVERCLDELAGRYDRVAVVYGDCGTRGSLDAMLDARGLERLAVAHCYELYAGAVFADRMADEPGTFFFTDFLVRSFAGTVLRALGIDRHPELAQDYFAHYRRVVYLAQSDDPRLVAEAERIAARLGLPLEVRRTGLTGLERGLETLLGVDRLGGRAPAVQSAASQSVADRGGAPGRPPPAAGGAPEPP